MDCLFGEGHEPHGPTACGIVPGAPYECACGCDVFYNSCDTNFAWYKEQSEEFARLRKVGT